MKLKDLNNISTEKLEIYPHLANQIQVNTLQEVINAFEIICNPKTLLYAYKMIKSNPGNMVPGTDEETMDGIDDA
jgi:hypothetical protein